MIPALRVIPIVILYLLILGGFIYRGDYMDAVILSLPFAWCGLALYTRFVEDEDEE